MPGDPGTPGRRGVIRLVVPSPDGTRVLARPNGLAGWALPTMAVDGPLGTWDDAAVERASRAVGAAVVPGRRVADDAWVLHPEERVPATGRTWIGLDEAGRLGADAEVVRAWWDACDEPSAPPTHRGGPPG